MASHSPKNQAIQTPKKIEIGFEIRITEGPPLTRKSLTRFPLPRFFAYVRVSGGISVSRGPPTVPLTRISCNKSQNARKAGTLCRCFHLKISSGPSDNSGPFGNPLFWKPRCCSSRAWGSHSSYG